MTSSGPTTAVSSASPPNSDRSARQIVRGSLLARRLFWLFVVAALLPLALSDWLATATVGELVRSLQQRNQARITRQTGLQVFDRLTAAKALLAQLPDKGRDPPRLPASASRIFERLLPVGALHSAEADALRHDWQRADHGASGPAPEPLKPEPGAVRALLRILFDDGRPARLLLASVDAQGRPVWLGELDPQQLWKPLADAAIDSGWRVLDDRGRTLATQGEPALLPPAPRGAASAGDDMLLVRSSVFLGAEFGAGAWEFVEQRAAPQARWLGVPLVGWLALVAAATVLLIALVSRRAIGRMLVPLGLLTDGTRRLAAGVGGTRVAVAGDDEFGQLGAAFNEMASRIEGQLDALQQKAAVDRDVLAGAPIEQVVGRVLAQLGRARPDVPALFAWLEPGDRGRLRQLGRDPQAGPSLVDATIEMTADQLACFAAMGADTTIGPAADCGLPWPGAAWPPSQHAPALALLPLRWEDDTRALLVLALPVADAALLATAAELRDHLAVAFSARERERLMMHRAIHDSLTGLANRAGLGEALDRLLAGHEHGEHAVLFIDLDHFKDANDSLGHEAGDAILCEAARRLCRCVGAGGLVARQGGDEFVILLADTGSEQALASAAKVVEQFGHPFELGGEQHRFGASVGIALYPQHGRSRTELLRHADLAMYAAKQAGRARYQLFDERLDAAAQERLRIPRELRRDMDLGKLVGHFQARIAPADGRVTSVESLVRWQHPERGLVMPDAFISLAEESSLIEDLGNWMLNEACGRMSVWRKLHPSLQRISVNVSPRQLTSGQLIGHVQAALARHQLPAQALELEVTESLLVENADSACAQLAELRRIGVRIALDDFGTGFSSMSMLRRLPIDVMKIDRAFVRDLDSDESARAITRSIAELARSLGLHLVAEGIETAGQAALLAELGCDEFQGYLYSRPLPPGEFSRLCTARDVVLAAAGAAYRTAA